MRLFVAGLRKLVRRPAHVCHVRPPGRPLSLILMRRRDGRTARCGKAPSRLLLVTFPGAYTLILSFILGLGGLFALIYGAAVAGSEWTWGTLKSAVARGEPESLPAFLSLARSRSCSASAWWPPSLSAWPSP